jgi:NCS2 family nucleobase:cation symporter-2
VIVCGILSCIQITRFHIWKTPYYIGTGLISVVGTSFAIIPVATGAFTQMYANGKCQLDADGNRLPCPDAYGALIGTCALCALVEIGLSFLPPHALRKIFPPIVTGPTVILIGVSLIESGFQNWAGGSGLCAARPDSGPFQVCPQVGAPHALPWGSAEYIGLGFLVFVTILLCERFGSPIMKSTSVILGLLTGCIVAAACGYFDDSGINAAPVGSFIWVKTFKLSLYGPIVLPIMVVFIICACEAIGDITATCDVSRLEVEGPQFESRIQGGVLADGLNGCLAALMTITPMSTFAQNNGVIALTRCANRKAGYFCCCKLTSCRPLLPFANDSRSLLDRCRHLCQIFRRPCGHSLVSSGWHDDVPLLRSSSVWNGDCQPSPLQPPNPVHSDSIACSGIRRHARPHVVQLRLHISRLKPRTSRFL